MKNILANRWILFSSVLLLFLIFNGALALKYFHIDLSTGKLVLFLIPAIIYMKYPGRFSTRFTFPALGTLLLFCITGEVYFLFALGIFTLLLTVEMLWGKLNNFTWIALFICTSVFKYLFDIFGFNIKLLLTKLAASFLSVFHSDIVQAGNVVTLNGESFIVDTACMGLKLTTTSFLLTMMLISILERKLKRHFLTSKVLFLFLLSFGLLLFANFARIVVIIKFRLLEDSSYHMLAGLVTLALFHTLPLAIIIKENGVKWSSIIQTESPQNRKSILGVLSITTLMICNTFFVLNPSLFAHRKQHGTVQRIPSLNYVETQFGLDCYVNNNSVIYIKPPAKFYSVNHNPFICWRGNGYTILIEKREVFGNKNVYYGELQNGDEKLYTAWWFDNGKHQTNSEMEWRWDNLTGGDNYSIVNITAKTRENLFLELNHFESNVLFQ